MAIGFHSREGEVDLNLPGTEGHAGKKANSPELEITTGQITAFEARPTDPPLRLSPRPPFPCRRHRGTMRKIVAGGR